MRAAIWTLGGSLCLHCRACTPRRLPTSPPNLTLHAHPLPLRSSLTGMLNPNPEKRMGLDDIFQHAWFLKDLPPGALGMNDWCAAGYAVVQHCCALVNASYRPAGCPCCLACALGSAASQRAASWLASATLHAWGWPAGPCLPTPCRQSTPAVPAVLPAGTWRTRTACRTG